MTYVGNRSVEGVSPHSSSRNTYDGGVFLPKICWAHARDNTTVVDFYT